MSLHLITTTHFATSVFQTFNGCSFLGNRWYVHLNEADCVYLHVLPGCSFWRMDGVLFLKS